MLKNFEEYRCHGRRPVLYTAALIVLGTSFVLTGCGDISLSGLLEKQAPGELGIIPQTATISPNTSIEISGKGGFVPYSFSATDGSISKTDGVTSYTAPVSAAADVIITVVDALSNEATAIIKIESPANPFTFPEAMTIAVGESTGYVQADGGDITVSGKYTFWLEPDGAGTLAPHPSFPEDRVKYTAPDYVPTGPVLLRAEDDVGQVSTLEVTVVAGSGS